MTSVLVPSGETDYRSQLRVLVAAEPLPLFDAIAVDYLDAVSKAVLLDPGLRRMPEMAAAAHWMRRAHIFEIRKRFEAGGGECLRLARGVALHFAPANVDSIFLYSWFISLLLGNANIVRLSERRGSQVDLLLEKINSVLEHGRFGPIRDRSLLLAYDHNDALTAELSGCCHVRVLWGGDESVRRLRAIPMNPLAIEVAFANRFSLAAMDATAVAKADDAQLASLASRFYNDAYWFNQMACSSPRLVAWVGTADVCSSAQTVFWIALSREIEKRGFQLPEVAGINKLVHAYSSAGVGISDGISPGVTGAISRVHLAKCVDGRFRAVDCGGGFFFETEISALDQLRTLLTERDQTICYFGFDRAQLKRFAASLPARAVDRIVPIGAALDFGTVWDGINLLQLFSREVDLQ